MPPEKQKIALVVQCHDLTTLEFWKLRESGLEHAAHSMT